MKIYLTIIWCLIFPAISYAQREKKVDVQYTFISSDNLSLEQARRIALERAQVQAIADEFGTIVSQSNSSFVKNENGNTSLDFQSIGGSDVKGEWIETIGAPKYEQGFTDDGQMWVKCTVKGRIREIVSAQIDLIAKVLRNGTEEKYEGYDFNSGDDMYLYFKSPVNGFLSVYLIDESSRTAFCLLPYSQSSDAVQKIEHDQSYVFFSPKHAPQSQRNIVDELSLTCNDEVERNDIYVIFSPNAFVKANSVHKDEILPRELSWEDFNKWLVKNRKHDNSMTVVRNMISITKSNR